MRRDRVGRNDEVTEICESDDDNHENVPKYSERRKKDAMHLSPDCCDRFGIMSIIIVNSLCILIQDTNISDPTPWKRILDREE